MGTDAYVIIIKGGVKEIYYERYDTMPSGYYGMRVEEVMRGGEVKTGEREEGVVTYEDLNYVVYTYIINMDEDVMEIRNYGRRMGMKYKISENPRWVEEAIRRTEEEELEEDEEEIDYVEAEGRYPYNEEEYKWGEYDGLGESNKGVDGEEKEEYKEAKEKYKLHKLYKEEMEKNEEFKRVTESVVTIKYL
jgi:hypothetical protein